MHNFENTFYDSCGIGRNLWETAEVDIQATRFTKGDCLFIYTNYTTNFYVAFFTKGFCALRYCNNDNAIGKDLTVV